MDTNAAARMLLGAAPLAPWAVRALHCLTGLDKGRAFPVPDGATEIGRGERADVRIRDRRVSRRHARLYLDGAALFVEAYSPACAVSLNGEPLRGRARLCDGDELALGATALRYEDPCAQTNAPAPPRTAPTASRSPRRLQLADAAAALGAALLLSGLLLAWTFSREAEPAPRDPPTAASAAGDARRSW